MLVQLTDAGHRAIDTTLDALLDCEQELFSGLTREDQDQLVALLRLLLFNLIDRTGAREWPTA